jgi:hypothetical protein
VSLKDFDARRRLEHEFADARIAELIQELNALAAHSPPSTHSLTSAISASAGSVRINPV